MTGNDVRAKFLTYMEKRGHALIPSSSLVPENDPTTLFTGSGMQPLIPFLMGESHPMGTRLMDSQRCFRAEDIEEVGDNRHTTFFEMLGNWSLGDYFKDEQISWMFEFLIDELGLNPEKLYITAFIGDKVNKVPKDTESAELWKQLFHKKQIVAEVADMNTEEEASQRGMKAGERIFYYNAKKNWWSRSGGPEKMPVGEIGGPDTEMFYDFGLPHDKKYGEFCHPNCDCGRFMEIGNNVFIEYVKNEDGAFKKLPKRNVDFGGGLERIAAAVNDNADVFEVDLLKNIIERLELLSGKKYFDYPLAFRIIADHIRGAVFMISDGVYPSNTEQGYFTRRLLRRAVRYADTLEVPNGELKVLAKTVIDIFKDHYVQIAERESDIIESIFAEEIQFRKTLEQGLKEFNKVALKLTIPVKKVNGKVVSDSSKKPTQQKFITGESAFNLFTTYGFPIELTIEIAKERGMTVALDEFKTCMDKHRELSRTSSEQKFKGGLADHGNRVVMYHTATHLLLAGLRKELGDSVHQAGSNITNERLRFDFTYDEKVTDDILKKVEEYVNTAIRNDLPVAIETLSKIDAENDPTIEGSFWNKYPDQVKVYTIKNSQGEICSRELCGGPHVENTSAMQGTFKIIKEESSSRGVRRIKAILD
ncbi:MAG: alanine--tRNA ligase [Candidatus Pacebacteria bacterium]|nr:alanine--tRNA ligase [Candidatus Paceibacterota bacterium]MCF7857063.1 alanine--tRNA ligase [Candidatus Paceibacterota bacterium]